MLLESLEYYTNDVCIAVVISGFVSVAKQKYDWSRRGCNFGPELRNGYLRKITQSYIFLRCWKKTSIVIVGGLIGGWKTSIKERIE